MSAFKCSVMSDVSLGVSATCMPQTPTIMIACVTRKVTKIGIRTVIDSLTPRRLSTTKNKIAAVSAQTFHDCQ